MIVGIFHQGSGLGNQLHRYVATRVRAADLGVDWDMVFNPDGSGKEAGFKGKSFMDIGWKETEQKRAVAIYSSTDPIERPNNSYDIFTEKSTRDDVSGVDIRSYDPEFNFIEDGTLIDGEFQDERYWAHREKEVSEWLKVEPLEVPDDTCTIAFRGGEFALYPDLFLTKGYWEQGINMMRGINAEMKFEVHTDDAPLAERFFSDYLNLFKSDFKVIHDIGVNWRSLRYAKHAIISNSSFAILPRWLRNGVTIAPRYWGRRNTKIWSLPQNYSKRFTYL